MISATSSSSTFVPTADSSAKPKSGFRSHPPSKWRSGAQQQIYGRRLLEALRATRIPDRGPSMAAPQAIKEAADSALALTARGQTRWSRALLFSRFRRRKVLLKAGGKIRRRRKVSDYAPAGMKGQKVKDRLRVLSRLVPGCRKLSAPNLLDEAADYVAALEMQVKTMRALADALSSAALSPPIGFAFASN